jgi:hypothetical protein
VSDVQAGTALVRATVCVVALGFAPAALAESPSAQMKASLAAADAQQSVHYVSRATGASFSVTMVGDAGRSSGIQRITYTKGGKSGHVTVMVVADTAYIRGDAFALQNYLGFTASAATEAKGKWISLAKTEPSYATVAAGVRLASTMSELRLKAPLSTLGSSQGGGRPVIGIRDKFLVSGHRFTGTLYVSASGSPLPVEEKQTSSVEKFDVVLSHWNEKLTLSAPSGSGTVA